MDRQQGGMANLNKVGVNSHSIVTLHLLAEVLEAKKHISGEMKDKIFAYVRDNQISLEPATKPKKKELSFQERKKLCKSEFSRVVLDLMTEKKSNLVLAADVNSTKEVLHLADLLGPEICMLKTHVDMLGNIATIRVVNKRPTNVHQQMTSTLNLSSNLVSLQESTDF